MKLPHAGSEHSAIPQAASRTPLSVATRIGATGSMPAVVAAAAAASAALRHQFSTGITICLVVSLVLIPVWWGALRGYRMGRTIVILGTLAAIVGAAISLTDSTRAFSMMLLQGQTLNFLSFVGSIGLLIWCREQIGLSWTAIWYGIGSLMEVALSGVDPANAWKYTLAFPISIAVLAVVATFRSRALEVVALLVLAGVSVLSDSRSFTAFLLLTAVIIAAQVVLGSDTVRLRAWHVVLLFGTLAVSAYNIFQAMMLDGMLGDYAQQRTQAQVEASGSLITGGRPEIGASWALIRANPWGYGSGTIPNSTDVWTAKSGMSALNYDPDNGYVEHYMFGGQFELHSVLGDLWIRFGPLGAIFALVLLGCAVYGVARVVSQRSATAVVVLLMLLVAWDTFFSPILPSYRALALIFPLTAIPLGRHGPEDSSGAVDGVSRAGRRALGRG